jgi:RND family efflux transporter MFP subunit
MVTEPAERMTLLKQAIVSLCLVAAAFLFWDRREALLDLVGWSAPSERAVRAVAEGVPVIAARVGEARDDLPFEAVGTGRAVRSAVLRVDGTGKIVESALAAGRRFEAGETILRLEDRRQRLDVAAAEARLAEAERTLARSERLEDSGSGAVSEAALEDARTVAEIARIELDRAEEALAERTLRAPFDGVAGLPGFEIGDRIGPEDAVASFDDRGVILVAFDLPEALLARVEEGDALEVTTPAAPGRTFEGRVAAIDSRVDVLSRAAVVRAAVPNPDDAMRPGASFRVRLELEGETYAAVPELALQFARGTLHVWRVRDSRAERLEVALVRRRAGVVLVEGPLSPGDLVAVEGARRLSEGEAVDVIGRRGGGEA